MPFKRQPRMKHPLIVSAELNIDYWIFKKTKGECPIANNEWPISKCFRSSDFCPLTFVLWLPTSGLWLL